MNESTYISQSRDYASNAQTDYENSLNNLLSGLDENKDLDTEVLNERYDNLIDQIRQQIPELQEQFESGAKSAYITSKENLQQINADLSRLGVNTQGFGVTQRLQNQIAYGDAYNDLQLDLNSGLRDIANQETNALGELNASLKELDAQYAKDKLQTEQYIKEQGLIAYESAYDKKYQDLQYQDALKQQQYENEKAEQQYQDALKQQAWENEFQEKQYADSLAQQAFENRIAEQQLALQRQSVYNQNISRQNDQYNNTYVTNTSNMCPILSSKNATDYANQIYAYDKENGGIKIEDLDDLLSTGIAEGYLNKSDATAIRKVYN